MLSASSVAESRGCHILLQRAPKGTPSSILTLRLRRCFHQQKASRSPISYSSPIYSLRSICRHARHLSNSDTTSGVRYATTQSTPSLVSYDAVAHVQSLLAHLDTGIPRGAEHPGRSHASNTPTGHGPNLEPIPAPYGTNTRAVDPFRGALVAMREGDTRRVLTQLHVIEKMSQEDLQNAVASIPRTTFTEFFRALDPLRVARDCDPAGHSHIPVGMYQMLNMASIVDEYGIRRLYTQLMHRLLILMSALQVAGYTLHLEEYTSLIRCAGACSDISGAGALWNNLSTGPLLKWRNSALYTEYIKARFLTEPLYTNYQKITRMVTPRNLHRSRLTLSAPAVQRLDRLRAKVRSKRFRFGLNKDSPHVEELMRLLRGHGPALRLFRTVLAYHSFRVDERLLCALMIALGRAGSLRFVGEQILQIFFGIRTPHPFPLEPENELRSLSFSSEPPRIRPSVHLMRAIVETYASNGEVGVAVQLVEYLSNTYNIPIPRDVWQELLEWTYLMSTPPASTAWEEAKLYAKIPSPEAIEMIWNAMISPPYNQTPTFENYDILIRSLIGRRNDDLAPVLSRMREAILLYDEQCRRYEEAVFEYTLYVRSGKTPGAIVNRFELARHKKQRMWYDISTWCRMLLKRLPFSKVSPIPNPLAPHFIEEFRPFLKNPVEYLTPTGCVSLVDPAIETFKRITIGSIEQTVPMKNSRGKWTVKKLQQKKLAILSSHSLAKFKASLVKYPLTLIAPHRDAFVAPVVEPRQADGPYEEEAR
ncbi:hypothetical protein GQX73_g2231 [Xylaria multiplex]|uniref:Pentatricopeptide repeat domain-containing protein n=1 Tax=Xylaria multiplex TaxID=323545 RepID=A0A7C8MWS0_9PEZI|nr:hypothetical protein GQX73_g2231 [Xylaria multiplex]